MLSYTLRTLQSSAQTKREKRCLYLPDIDPLKNRDLSIFPTRQTVKAG